MQSTKQTIDQQVSDLVTKRYELHSEMTRNIGRMDSTWFKDRAREMEYVNRQLARLGALQSN